MTQTAFNFASKICIRKMADSRLDVNNFVKLCENQFLLVNFPLVGEKGQPVAGDVQVVTEASSNE